MILLIVYRLAREAWVTKTTKLKMPRHILLVGAGSAVWGIGQLDTVYDHLGDKMPPEWSAAPTALIGALILHVGLWKMIEIQRIRYRTMGGQGTSADVAAEFVENNASLQEKNAEKIVRLFVESRVLYAIVMVAVIFGFARTTTITHDTCVNNNVQDSILIGLVKVRLATDPSALADDPAGARRVREAFEDALRQLSKSQKCPAGGL